MNPSHPQQTTTTRRIGIAIAALLTGLLLFSVGANAASAAPGQLDPKFSGDGYADLTIGASDQAADLLYSGHRRVVVSVSDGRLVLAGIGAHGNLDPGFGSNGVVTQSFPGAVSSASGAVDAHGRELVAVNADTGVVNAARAYLLRFSHNGQLDPSFGKGGVVSVSGHGLDAVAVSPNGTIVTAGRGEHGSQANSVESELDFSRWTGAGAPDRSFGSGGELHITTATCGASLPFSCAGRTWTTEGLAVQANGALVASANVVSACCQYGTFTSGLALVGPDGRSNSLKTNVFPSESNYGGFAGGLALQRDGKILVTGSVVDPTPVGSTLRNAAGIARLLPNGTPDQSFDGDGFRYVHSAAYDSGTDVALDQRGRIYIAGTTADSNGGASSDSFLGARLLPSGALDPTFGGGVVRTRFHNGVTNSFSVPKRYPSLIVDARGRPVLAETVGDHIALVRYLAGK